MTIIDAIILGVVEGITEFLPVSSTGHLMLTSKIIGLPTTEFLKTFEIAIQFGAILSVVVLYWKRFLVDFDVIKKIMAAFIPTAVMGLFLYKLVKKYFLNSELLVLCSLLIGGILIIVFEKIYQEKPLGQKDIKQMSFKTAVLIGLFQSIAMIPGVSRSAATIMGGMLLGVNRKTIVEFSFLLAVPTMMAATILDLFKSAANFSSDQFSILGVGFIMSFVIAIISIKFLIYFIKNHNFIGFGIYRIIAAFVFAVFFLR